MYVYILCTYGIQLCTVTPILSFVQCHISFRLLPPSVATFVFIGILLRKSHECTYIYIYNIYIYIYIYIKYIKHKSIMYKKCTLYI